MTDVTVFQPKNESRFFKKRPEYKSIFTSVYSFTEK